MKTKTRFHKLTAWLLTLAMLMTFIPTFSQFGTGLTVYATEGTGSDSDDSELGGGTGDGGSEAGSGGSSGTEGDGTAVSYLAPVYENGEIKLDANNDVVFETKTVTDYIVAEDIAYGGTITSADQMPTVGTSGDTTWYVADSDVEWENFVLVQGDVHLVICDDITITSIYGIVVSNGNNLTIYGQENGTGTLVAKGVNYSEDFYSAAIGGCDVTTEMANGGVITINGGIISASASPNAAAIGGSKRGTGGTITINGGSVDAKGAAYSAAIGGGSGGNSGNIIINGGIVSAETSGSSSAIGAGYVRYSSTGESIFAKTDKIEINGGTVVATHTDSYEEYPVIGGLYGFDNINISGGHITVNHARSDGIGIGTNSVTVMKFDGNLNISGGTIISGNDKTLYLGAGKTSSSAKGTVDVVVTGGNISGTFKNVSTLKDGKNDVEMKEITIDGAEDQTEVTVLEDYPTYGLCDVVTDGDKVVIYVPVSKAYTITVSDTIENGTVEADVSEASEGDTVTLTVTPDDGFEIDTVSYNSGTNDNEITPDDGVYSFIMPASDVTVSAVFEEEADTVLPVAAVTTADNVTTEYSDIQFAIDAAEASAGSTLKLLEDVDTHVLIEGGTFTLDLNGHNIEADTLFDGSFITRMNALTIWNDANITLEGSGSIISNCILNNSSTTFCYCIYNRGKLRIDGDIELKTNEYRYNSGVYSYNGQLTIDNCSINARLYAITCYESNTTINGGNFQSGGSCLDIDNANVTVKGGSFTGEGYDCYVHTSSNPSTVKLGVGDDGSGPIFPGGIIVFNTVGLSDLLDENCYFKQNGTSVDMTNITTEITGDVSVAYCDHSENTNTIPTADDASTHSLFCSDCGAIVSHGNHSLDGGICTGCGYGCSHSSCITENNVTKCAQCPVVLVAQVGDAYFAKLSDAVAAANDTNGSTLTLLADVKGDFTVDASSVFTLDLNGKTLRGTGHDSIITISTIAELTIKSSVSGGKITGCDNQTVNGTIFVSGTLKLESGEITGNSVEYGGGVVVADGTFVMNGGEITGNTVKYCGGGVYMLGNGSFTMNGGSISDNVVRIDDKNMQIEGFPGGGGVFIRQGTFTMNGGTISGNRSVYTRGGGVQVSGYGTFIMNGGSVTGNSALEKGGGVYVMNGWDNEPAGSFTVNGNSVISGNTVNGDANNVYLEAPLSIGSNLSTTAGIGITVSTTPTDTGVEIASSGATEINKSAFISDNINYSIVQKEGKLYLYPHIHSWTYTKDGDNKITAACDATECTDPDGGYITISAPSDLIYNGSKIEAVVDNKLSTGADVSVTYIGNTTNDYPVNAGDYTASITLGGVTASVDFNIEKATVSNVSFDVTAPKALATKQTTIENGTDYTAAISWNAEDEKYGFNTIYIATVTLTADGNHKFADTLSKDGWTVALNNDKTVATFTKTFEATRKQKIESVTSPTNVNLDSHKSDAAAVIATLPTTVLVVLEENGTDNLAIEWSCANFNTAPLSENTFTWTATNTKYDSNNVVLTGTITVTNPAANAVKITVKTENTTVVYNAADIDLTSLFDIDTNAGHATYTVTNGTGAGTQNGTALSVTKAGTFTVKVDTVANGIYAAGTQSATLTVEKANGTGTVSMEGWTYGETAKEPVVSDNKGAATYQYKVKGADDSAYSPDKPSNAGEYTVKATFAETDLYKETTATADFTIAKAQAVISVDTTPIVKTYGDTWELPAASTDFGTVSADKTVAEMVNAGEYTVTYTVAGNDNYNGDTKTVSVTINPKKIDKASADNTSFVYDGNEHTYNVATSDYYTVTGNKMTNAGSQTVTVALKDKVNYTWNDGKTDDVTFTFTIAQKGITGATVGNFEALTYTGGVQTPFATVTIDGLIVTGTWSDVTNVADKTTFTANGNFTGTIADKETGMLKDNSSVATVPGANALTYSETAQELVIAGVANGGTLKYSLDNTTWVDAIPTGTNADTYEVWYKVFGDANHNDTDSVKVDVTIAKKSIEAATVALDGTLTYTGAEQTQNVTVTLDGFTVTFDVTDNTATNVKADGNYTLKVTANGNFTGEKTLEWNIAKANHIIEGENIPTASRIRRGNKLSDSTITPAELKDADGNVLGTFTWVTPDDEMTETGDFVKQVKFTPTDTTNYNEKTFDVTVNVYRPSSGGGGSSSNTTTTTTKNEDGSTTKVTENKTTGTKTEVTTNTDGSTTTVETKKDGTVTTTEKDKDGNTTTTVEKSDGTSTTTEKNKDGSEKVTEKSADGTTVTTEKDTDGTKTVTTENADGSTTIEETKKDGTKVTTETNADGETTSEITVPNNKETEVVIPVDNADEVTKVVVTDKDGNETEAAFEVKDGSIAISVSGDSTVSVQTGHICYAKDFTDVDIDAWYHENVCYVLGKGLMKGTAADKFTPNDNLTRAMLVTILYRAEGEPATNRSIPFDDVDMGSWYASAVIWAQQNCIVNGVTETEFAPNDNITREQIAAILYRYAIYKGMDAVNLSENLGFADADEISEYAISAMNWAVGSGLIKGYEDNTVRPLNNATRAEAAAILERFIKAN